MADDIAAHAQRLFGEQRRDLPPEEPRPTAEGIPFNSYVPTIGDVRRPPAAPPAAKPRKSRRRGGF